MRNSVTRSKEPLSITFTGCWDYMNPHLLRRLHLFPFDVSHISLCVLGVLAHTVIFLFHTTFLLWFPSSLQSDVFLWPMFLFFCFFFAVVEYIALFFCQVRGISCHITSQIQLLCLDEPYNYFSFKLL